MNTWPMFDSWPVDFFNVLFLIVFVQNSSDGCELFQVVHGCSIYFVGVLRGRLFRSGFGSSWCR